MNQTPPKSIIARSVTPGDRINVQNEWVVVTKKEFVGRMVILFWEKGGTLMDITLYTHDHVNVQLKGFDDFTGLENQKGS